MSRLSIHLFGKFSAQRDGHTLGGFTARKVQELCGYLLLYRERPHAREELATLFWGESPSAQAKKQLRQTVWQLRSALSEHAEPTDRCALLVRPEWVSINTETDIWLDLALFEHALMRTRGVLGRDLDADSATELAHAVQLYRGDLLEGSYQDWCLFERERLQSAYLAMLDKLMDYCEAHDECEKGLDYGETILRYDRARERTHQRLMRLYVRSGDRAGALRQFERCAAALKEELSVRPGQRTVALYEQIRADGLGSAPAGPAPASPAPPPSLAPLTEAATRLRELRTVLNDLERQLRQGIEAAEAALRSVR